MASVISLVPNVVAHLYAEDNYATLYSCSLTSRDFASESSKALYRRVVYRSSAQDVVLHLRRQQAGPVSDIRNAQCDSAAHGLISPQRQTWLESSCLLHNAPYVRELRVEGALWIGSS
jgi:hypothetical protein